MADEIVIKFGADTGAATAAMQSMANTASSAASGIKNSFSQMRSSAQAAGQQASSAAKQIENAAKPLNSGLFSGFNNAISGVKESLNNLASGGGSAISSLMGSLGSLKGVFVMLAAVAGGGKLFGEFASDAKAAAGETKSLAQTLGMPYREASVLRTALTTVGIETGTYSAMTMMLTRNLKNNEEAFQRHGVATRDAAGNLLPLNQIIRNSVEAMYQYKAGADQDMVAMDLVGKKAQDLIAAGKLTGAVMSRAAEDNKRFGLSISGENIQASGQFSQEMNRLKLVMTGFSVDIGNRLIPILARLAPICVEVAATLSSGFRAALDALSPIFNGLYEAISGVIKYLVEFGQSVMQGADTTSIFGTASQALSSVLDTCSLAWQSVKDFAAQFGKELRDNLLPAISGIVNSAIKLLISALQLLAPIIVMVVTQLKMLITGFLDLCGVDVKTWGDIATKIFEGIHATLLVVIQGIVQFCNVLAGLLTGLSIIASTAARIVKDLATLNWGDISQAARDCVSQMRETWNSTLAQMENDFVKFNNDILKIGMPNPKPSVHGSVEPGSKVGPPAPEEPKGGTKTYISKPKDEKEKSGGGGGPTDVQVWEEELEQRKETAMQEEGLLEYSKKKELEYWQEKLLMTEEGTKEYLAVRKKIFALEKGIATEEYQEKLANIKYEEALAKSSAAQQVELEKQKAQLVLMAYGEGSAQYKEALRSVAEAERRYKEESRKLETEHAGRMQSAMLEEANFQKEMGNLKETDVIQVEMAISSEKYQQELKQLADQYSFQNQSLEAQREYEEKKKAITEQYNLEMQKLEQKAALENKKSWDSWLEPCTSAMKGMVTGILQGTQSIKQVWQNALKNMLASYAEHVLEIVAKEIWKQAQLLAKSIAGSTARKTIETSSKIGATALEGAEVAAHAAAETKKTGATLAGTTARSTAETKASGKNILQKLFETIFHTSRETTKTVATTTGVATRSMTENTSSLALMEREGIIAAAHTTNEGTKTAATVAGSAARQAAETSASSSGFLQTAWNAIKGIMNNAYKAAAATYASVAEIPGVGWLMAPLAAAAAFIAVAAFGGGIVSAAGGYELDKDQLIQAHANEVVLPAKWSSRLKDLTDTYANARQQIDSSTAIATRQSSTANINVTAVDSRSFARALNDSSSDVVKVLKQLHRNGSLSFLKG